MNDEITNKAKGIMDGLENMDDEKENKGVNKEKSKRVNKEKKKRSFMLTEDEIEKIYIMKAKSQDKTLSQIVGNAIDLLYKRVNE